MSEGTKIERYQAWSLAQEVLAHLSGVFQRAEIAGSLRRGKKMVGDIEIVCVAFPGG